VAYYWPTNDGAIFYTRVGAGPPHMTYQYEEFDFWGNIVFHVDFEKYDDNMDDIYDDRDLYIFDGEEVSKEEWDALTEKYLSASTDLIKWYPLSEGVNHIQ
jgi:hypothetical protein